MGAEDLYSGLVSNDSSSFVQFYLISVLTYWLAYLAAATLCAAFVSSSRI